MVHVTTPMPSLIHILPYILNTYARMHASVRVSLSANQTLTLTAPLRTHAGTALRKQRKQHPHLAGSCHPDPHPDPNPLSRP